MIIFDGIQFYETKYKNYYVSRCGKIISTKVKGGRGLVDKNNPRYHSTKVDKDGYFEVCISMVVNGVHKRIYRRLHRLVYETFNGEICGVIDHIDSNKQNNAIENLQDVSAIKNTMLAYDRKPRRFKGVIGDKEFDIVVTRFQELVDALGISEATIRKALKAGKMLYRYRYKKYIIEIEECND